MGSIRIDLQEGFEDEAVIIKVNGRDVFNKDHVRTRLQVGKADSVTTRVPAGAFDVEVILPGRGRSKALRVDAAEGSYLGVSVLDGGEVTIRVAREPFGYA